MHKLHDNVSRKRLKMNSPFHKGTADSNRQSHAGVLPVAKCFKNVTLRPWVYLQNYISAFSYDRYCWVPQDMGTPWDS